MASLDDILTIQKNGVVGINGLTQAVLRYIGTNTTASVATTLVVAGAGRVVNVSIVDGGSAEGYIYNARSAASLTDSQKLAVIGMTAGVTVLNLVFTAGLVIVPGTGQLVNVTYSIG
jgi:hypothetical protein